MGSVISTNICTNVCIIAESNAAVRLVCAVRRKKRSASCFCAGKGVKLILKSEDATDLQRK